MEFQILDPESGEPLNPATIEGRRKSVGAIVGTVKSRYEKLLGEELSPEMEEALNNLKKDEHGLFKRYRLGTSSIDGMIEDYAFLIWGLIELYQVTFDIEYLNEAKKLADYQIDNFWDEKNGGFYFYDKNSEDLIVRPKEIYDGAIPSGNSVSTYNFMRLKRLEYNIKIKKMDNNLFWI